MFRLLSVRHGETEWNTQGRYQGQLDSPLTPLGIAQAEALGLRLADEPIDASVISDLPRAQHSADLLLAGHPLTPRHFEPRLRERHFGAFSGLTRAEAMARDPASEARYLAGDPDFRLPGGGESLRDVQERTCSAIDAWADRYDGQTVLAVAHGGVLSVFLRAVLRIPLEVPRGYVVPNAALNIFEREQRVWRLRTWGDLEHLKVLETSDDASVTL
ncbi:MAG: histidine phosphatase family protein [Opitutales bacterium]